MRKRILFKLGILLIVAALSLGLFQFFKEYQAVNEEIKLRTAYYVKTGQILNVVQKDFLEGSTIESSNTDVAEITNDGGIEAKNPGIATVTVTKPIEEVQPNLPQFDPNTLPPEEREEYEEKAEEETLPQEEYEVSYDFDVVVKQPVEGIKLNVEIAQLMEGETVQLAPIFIPENAYNKTVSYQSMNNDVATVNEKGLVTAKKSGETMVEIITQDGGFKSNCAIKVFAKKETNDLYVKENSFELFTDEKVQVNANVTPNTDESKKIIYQSSDKNIFTVDENGVITGKVHGQAELIVKYENIEKRIPVTVKEVVVRSVQVSPKNLTLKEGETASLETIVEPSNALNKTVTYISSDKNIVEVEDGKVIGKRKGTATITVRADSGVTDTCMVEVKEKEVEIVEVSSVIVTPSTARLNIGETLQLNAVVTPETATDKTLSYASSDTSVVQVDQYGMVTAMNSGSATIKVTASNGKSSTMKIEVIKPNIAVSNITVSPNEINGVVGDTINLYTTIDPYNATDKNLSYRSSNDAVASVTQAGVVVLRKEGTATITVTSSNGVSATVNVVVTMPASLILNKQVVNLIQDDTEQLIATVKNSKDTSIIWSSQDTNIATVDQNGKIKAIGSSGTTTIIATLRSDPTVKATVIVNVTAKKISATSITVTNENTGVDLINHLFLVRNTTTNLKINLKPTNTSDKATVSFVGGQPTNLVDFDQSGNNIRIQAHNKAGTTKIKITAGNITKVIIIQVESDGDKMYFMCKNSNIPGNTDTWVTGDAIIIRSGNSFGMVDTGRVTTDVNPNATEDVFSVLNGLGIKTLDFIIISHWDSDHYGNVIKILKNYEVKKVYAKTYSHNGTPIYTYDLSNTTKQNKIKSIVNAITGKEALKGTNRNIGNILKKPSDFTFHNMKFEVYNKKDVYESHYSDCKKSGGCDENPQSLIYLVTVNGKKILLTGDSVKSRFDKSSTNNVQYNAYKKIGKVDVLKAAHHGYASNNPKESIDLIKPKYAVITNQSSRFGSWSSNSSLGHVNNAGYLNFNKYTKGNNYFTYGKVIISRYTDSKIYFAEAPATL